MPGENKDRPGKGPRPKGMKGLAPEQLYKAGTEQFRLRRYPQARGFIERYLELRPGDAGAYHLLARCLYHQGEDLDKAEQHLRKALSLDAPNQSRYLETLGILYVRQGEYAKAAEVLEFAIANDPKDDRRHSYSLEFHLGLARQRLRDEKGPGGPGEEGATPYFLASEMSRWRTRKRQAMFLLPSVLAHALLLLFVGYLSTHELSFKKETKEDFTYVDVGPGAEPMPAEEAAPIERVPPRAEAPEARPVRPEEATPVPAPVTPRAEVKTAGVQKESGRATGAASLKERGAAGSRETVGEKASKGLPSSGEPGEIVALAKAYPDKGVDVRGAKRGGPGREVDLVKKSLGSAQPSGPKTGTQGATARGLMERSGAKPATAGEGVFLGAGRPESGTKFEKEKLVDIKGKPGETRTETAPGSVGEKAVALNMPSRSRDLASGGPAGPKGLAAPMLGIGSGEKISPARAGAGIGQPGTVQRSEAAATGQGVGIAMPEKAGGPGMGGGKGRGSLGASSSEPGVPSGISGGERRAADIAGAPGGRKFASAEAVPGRRGLDIPSAGGAARQGGVARPGGGARQSFASPGKASGPASGGLPQGALTRAGTASGGYAPGTGPGKAVNSQALAGGAEEGAEAGGFFERAAKRVSAALGVGGGTGRPGGPTQADLKRTGSLSGLGGGGGGTGSGPGATGGGGRGPGGVTVAKAEKGRGGAYEKATAGGSLPSAGQGGGGLPGSKRMAESALGVPGGTYAEKYASAGRGVSRPGSTEKQSGVGGRGRLMARSSLGPVVQITSPRPGRTSRLSQVVEGTVSDVRTKKAILTVNNDSRVISVEQGAFEAVVSLSRGRNIVTVTAFDMDGNVGKDVITLDYVEPSEGAPVNIIAPRDGQVFDVSERSVVTVKGTIGDQEIKRAKLIFNGNPMDIAVHRGYFEQQVALVLERDSILVEAVSGDGAVSRSPMVSVGTVNVKPKDIMIILTWNKPRADMDLHVYGPGGGHTSYKSPNTYESREAIPGAQLEQDAKANFGPEVFTQERADKGIYTVKSNYFYSGGDGNALSTVTVILYGDNPSRRIVRVFGPHLQVDTKNGEDTWEVTRFKMPEGIFLED